MHKYGVEGYGLYFYCLELISHEVTTSKITFELEHDSEILAADMRMSREKVEDMLRYMVQQELFENIDGRLFCMKMLHRMDVSQTGNPAFRKQITELKKAKKDPNSQDTVRTLSGHSHDSVSKQSALEVDLEVDIKDMSDKSDDCRQIFDYWLQVMGKNPNQVKYSNERKQKIKARLRDYSVADIKSAINGCKKSPHHMGQNDSGAKYNDIELICRNSTKLESFIDLNKSNNKMGGDFDYV